MFTMSAIACEGGSRARARRANRLTAMRFDVRPLRSIHCIYMAPRKDDVLNMRVSERQRAAYERAAALEHTTLTAFVTGAADARAEEVLVAHSSVPVPSEVFEQLLAVLDQPGDKLQWMERALADRRFTNS